MKLVTPLKIAVAALALIALLAAGAADAKDETRGWLGVSLQDLSPSLVEAYNLPDAHGVLVNNVVDGSPAAEAGLVAGDVIISYAGRPIKGSGDLVEDVRTTPPGQKVNVVVVRDGTNRTLPVEIASRSADERYEIRLGGDDDEDVWVVGEGDDHFVWKNKPGGEEWVLKTMGHRTDRGYLGVHLEDLNEQLGEYFAVARGEGALIAEVIDDSPARKAGFKAGDVIVEFAGETITSAADLYATIAETEPEQEVRVKIVRKGAPKEIRATLGDLPESDKLSQFEMIAPHMEYRHLPKAMKFHAPDIDRQIMIERLLEGDVEEIDEMNEELRQELQEMRHELQEMQKELQELHKR